MGCGHLEFVEGDGLPDVNVDFGRPLTDFLTKIVRVRTDIGKTIEVVMTDDDVALGLAHASYTDGQIPKGDHLLNVVVTELDGRTRTYPSSGSISLQVRGEFSESVGGRRDSTISIREDTVTLTVDTQTINQKTSRTLYSVTSTGYDGDPNNAAAPSILQTAVVGSLYLRETNLTLYEKLTTGSFTWTKTASESTTTSEDLTIPVDYASTVDPPAGAVFRTQQDVDDGLAGAAGYKHINAVLEVLPDIYHTVTINLAAGIHRTRPGDTTYAWEYVKPIKGVGILYIIGPTSDSWPVLEASAAITGLQLASGDPYIDVAAATYPNDGSLKGKFVRLSTGQVTPIHDHTDSRLYVLDSLSPDPTGGTIEVVEQATIARNSLDDITPVASTGIRVRTSSPTITPNRLYIQNIAFDLFDLGTFGILAEASTVLMLSCSLAMDGGHVFSLSDSYVVLGGTTIIGDPPISGGSKTDAVVHISDFPSRVFFSRSYVLGGEDGLYVNARSEIVILDSVFDEVGKSGLAPAFGLGASSTLRVRDTGAGKISEIRNTAIGLQLTDSFLLPGSGGCGLRFVGCSDDCIQLLGNSVVRPGDDGSGLVDGGSNLGVGISVEGVGNTLDLDADTDVSGALGDLEIDGIIGTHADLVLDSPVHTQYNNTATKV